MSSTNGTPDDPMEVSVVKTEPAANSAVDGDSPNADTAPHNIKSEPPEGASHEDSEKSEEEESEENVAVENENEDPAPATGPEKQTRQERDTIKKDRSLAELLLMMDEYKPVIPDAVTDYYLSRSGFECDDVRVKRLLALAAQKFVSDIAVDALQYSKIRGQGPASAKDRRATQKEKRTVLTMEDLSAALADHGVNVKKPEYYL